MTEFNGEASTIPEIVRNRRLWNRASDRAREFAPAAQLVDPS